MVKRRSTRRLSAWSWLFAVSLSSSQPFFFETSNNGPKPTSNYFFDLFLIAVAVKRIKRFTRYVQGNVAAGNLFGAAPSRHQLHQYTITARTGIFFGIVVHASGRDFEDILRPPRSSRRTPIAPIFEELKFTF
jgi:hypothetical protein